MSRSFLRVICVAGSVIVCGLPLVAVAAPASQLPGLSPAALGDAEQATDARESEGELERFNELALAVVGTYEEEETYFTLGVEYERLLAEPIGIGAIVEYVNGKDSWVFVFPAYLHPYKGLEFVAGPGFEREDGENEFLVRVGVAYSFEFQERYSVTPFLEVDFVGRDGVLVFGSSFGVAF